MGDDKQRVCLLGASWHRPIQSDLEAGVPVWAPKLGLQKSFLVQYILSYMVIGNL